MKFEWKDLLPLAGVLVGWALTQFTQGLGGRRERKRGLARVLEGLLDVRHRLRSIPFAVNELAKRLPMGPRDQLMMSVVLSGLLPPETLKSFDDAVTAVAAEDPVLGYRLRSQNLAPTIVAQLRRFALQDANSAELWAHAEKELLNQVLPHLDDLILTVARIHGLTTRFRIRRTLKRKIEFPATLIDGLIERAQQAQTPAGFGSAAEWKAFLSKHAEFMKRFSGLVALLDRVFIRTASTNSPADRVVFFLGRLMVEDFMEILLLCGNGYGVAGLRLLRGMYERAVTAAYISKNPSEADRFLDYHHVHQWKLHKRFAETYKDEQVPPDQVEKMKGDFERVRDEFTEALCKKCGTTRPQISWSQLDTASMALKSGDGLEKMYRPVISSRLFKRTLPSRLWSPE